MIGARVLTRVHQTVAFPVPAMTDGFSANPLVDIREFLMDIWFRSFFTALPFSCSIALEISIAVSHLLQSHTSRNWS